MSLAQPTLDDIWKLFQETDRKFQETREEIREMFQETNKRFQATDEKFQATDAKFQATDKRFQATDEKFQATDKRMKEVTENIGRLGNKLGDFVEEMVRPAAVRLFRELGIEVHEVYQNVSATRNNEGIEIDLLVVNENHVIAIECKSTLGIDDVNDHLQRLEKLKRLLPAYATKQLMGAVAAMVVPENVANYAYRHGLYVIGQTGDQLVLRNDLKFKAKIW